jgi:hypothetical protein
MVCRKKNDNLRFRFFIYLLLCLSLVSMAGNPFPQYPPGQWETIIENQDFETPLKLEEGDDNTLIIGATFHNIDGDAITLRNVSNVYIKNCVIYSTNGNGIVLRSTGKTDKITIDGCTIYNTTKNGIIAKQDYVDDVNHTRLVIKNNILYNNGSHDLDHSIYVQTQDSKILNNEIHGSTGNGISIRSSGVVSGNKIWDTDKSCIRYFSDNVKGPSNTLLIENNICYLTLAGSQSPAVSLLWSDQASPDWMVDDYIIRFNTIAVLTDQRAGIVVESNQFDGKNIMVYGNIVINTQNPSGTIEKEHIDYLSSNYVSTSLDGFLNGQSAPFDFHITTGSPAVDYANKEINFPPRDDDGQLRLIGELDAGAYQLERNVSPSFIDNSLYVSKLLIYAGIALLGFMGIIILRKRKHRNIALNPRDSSHKSLSFFQ